MPNRYIYHTGRRFYYFETYDDWEDAYKIIKYYKKKNKTKYHVIKREAGYLFPYMVYDVYFSKIIRLGW